MKKIILTALAFLLISANPVYSGTPVPLPRDRQGSPIQAVSSIVAVTSLSITTSSYVAVNLPVNVPCKSIYVKTRSGNSWRMATSSSPVHYALMDFNFSLALVKTSPGVMFYARADSTNDTLEIIFMD